MKNFTNNFKQFTSRLSARWLIMALMMLVGTSSVWGYYVTGWNGDWNPTQYNMGGSNSYTINNVEAGTYEFKITDGTWGKTWGSGCLSSATGTASKIDNGDCGSNAKIKISTKSNVTIKFTCNSCYDKGGASIQVSATAVQVDPVNVTGYQLAGFNDWSNPITMTKNGDIYTCTKTLTAKTYTGGSNEAGFKIIENYSNSTQKWYGNTGTMTRANCSNWAFSEGSNNNCGITADIAGTYTFTFDASTKKLSVTYPAQSYTITYNANGGSGAPADQTKTHGTTLTLSSTVPTRTGYTFQNWNTKADGSGTSYAKGGTYTTDAAATLYAQWKINTYTITYNANNGSGAPAAQTKTYNVALTLSSTVPTRTGYTFQNWNTKADGSGTSYAKGGTYTTNAAATLYAQWKADTYAITYDANGGEGAPSQQTKTYGQNLTLSSTVPTRTGYTFQNWNTKADGSGTSYAKGGTYTTNAAATLYAQWTAKTYTITYKDKGGANFSGTHANGYPTTHTYGTATTLKTASKAGYTFEGWFTDSNCTQKVTSLGATDYTSAITLYAKWTEVCEPIAGLYWEITDGKKDIYCPGDVVSVRITYKGTTAKEYDWGGNYNGNIGILGGSIASGAVYTMTINKPGTVNLTLKGCDGETATTTTLEFTTYETPATPTIAFSVNPVGQSKETILSIASYSADNNYIVYRSADNAVGNDTEVGTYTAPMSIRHNDTGSYYYYAKATNKSCANLTATSEIVKLTVQEAGAIIAALGDLKIDAQDPVDFVAMYVKNDGLADFSAQGATSVTGYTWQFSSDGVNNWSNCASTNVVDGVNYELGMENGSANCNNFRPNKAGTYRCVVKYNTGDTQNSNYLTVTADGSTAKTFKGVTMTLPVVSVNTGSSSFPINNFGGTPSKNADKMKEKISVDVKIFENINGTTQVVYDRKARMNYRGSSSLNFLKKSYAFCPGDEICGDKKGIDYVKTKKLNMLGIGSAKDKDWVLYAAAADPSLMRNRLVFDTFRDMTGGWSVSSRYVELVVNGEYKGVYVMMDKITANKDRVNVEWKLDANGNTTQEAFIVKFDKTDREDRYEITSGDQKTFKSKYSGHDGFDTYDTNIDQRFEVEYPEKEDIEDGKGKWSEVFNAIENKINKFEEELAKGNFSEVQKLIDYTSWADWFIITEFAKNIDGYRASNLFVYDGSKPNAKIEARPLWDQELSFNNQCPSYYADYGSNSTSGLLIDKSNNAVYNNDASAPFWFTGKYKGDRGKYNGSDQTFKGLLDDPCFQAEVQARWAKHIGTNGALTSSALTTKMTGYLKDLDKNHDLSSSAITSGTPLDREFNTFWKNKSRATIDCGTGSGCYGGTTGYTDPTFHNSKVSLNNWLTGNRRTNLGNIINGWKGTELNITLTITPETGITTPWEAVMVQVNNPSGYDYDLEYTTNTLDKVSGVIINENNDKYTYRIPRPEDWKPGDEDKEGERTDIQYGIKATLKVGEGVAQCGNSSQAPSATTTITLKDEDNEKCQKP